MLHITKDKILAEELYKKEVSDFTCGGIVTFEGRVRKYNNKKEVASISYDCYFPMALNIMQKIKEEAIEKWKVKLVSIVHRIGHIPIGEIALWIYVASVHREEAFEACQFIINEIKTKLPIWKQEVYVDGTYEWVSGCKPVSCS